MKQAAQSIRNSNIGTFLDSATNAADKGQQQFFTPRPLAEVLFTPFKNGAHQAVLDPNHGSGNLLKASGIGRRFGLDIDAEAATPPDGSNGWHLTRADFTRWFPLADEVNLRADLIAINPPFSLRWHADRLAPLGESRHPHVAETFKRHSRNGTIDSTLASLLAGIHLLSDSGEGMLICNADTATRFLGHPSEEALAPARHHIWCWLEIPGTVFEGTVHSFSVAVLYFSASHGRHNTTAPLYLHSPSAEPDTVRQTLTTALTARPYAFKGRALTDAYLSNHETLADKWEAVITELAVRNGERKADLNLWLADNGTIRTHLDTFSHHKLDRSIAESLHALNGKRPEQLVVQIAARVALREAISGSTWNVCPKLVEAVEKAIAEYSAVRAPFFTPSPTKALGWIDEAERIEAITTGLEGIESGRRFKLRTFTEQITYKGEKTNLAGEKDSLTFSSQELVVEITGTGGHIHQFHVRRDKDQPQTETNSTSFVKDGSWDHKANLTHHHTIPALIQHFDIPIPQDITTVNPERYHRNKQILKQLEARIARRLATT